MRPPAPITEPVPAIGYIRVSTWYEEKISDEIQKAAILEAARRRGRHIVAWIIDLDATGRNFRRRIMEAIHAVETGSFDGAREIWVWKFSRFGRNRHGVAINLARVEKIGGELISATEDVDASTATGKLTRGMLFEIAAFESDRASEQWRETHQHRRASGLPATGKRRWGYVWTPRVDDSGQLQVEGYDPDPVTGPILGALYEQYLGGDGFYTLVEQLNGSQQRTVTGNLWSKSTLIHYLDSGFAAGLLWVHRSDVRCGNRATCRDYRNHYGHIPAAHAPVIGDDQWAAYKERREEKRALAPRLRRSTYPLSGLVRCGYCGGAAIMHGKGGHRGYGISCSRRHTIGDCRGCWMRRTVVEEEVRRWVHQVREEIDAIAAGTEVESRPETRMDTSRRRAELTAEIARRNTALERNQELYTLGDVERREFVRVRDRHRQARDAAEEELADLARDVESTPAAGGFRDVIIGLAEMWDTLLVETKQEMLRRATRGVFLRPGDDVPVRVVPAWEIDQ